MLGVFSSSHLRTLALRWGIASLTLAACLLAPTGAWAQAAEGELQKWVDESGSFQIEAKFVKLDGANVVLVTSEGKQLNVPYAKLSLSSQLKAKKAADPQAFVPPEFPSSYAPPPLAANPFPDDPTIEQFIDTFRAEVKAKHFDVYWHAMPPEMQSEVEKIVIKAADVVGPKTFKQLQAVLPNLLTIVRDKRSMILANPRIASQPELAKNMAEILPASEPMIEVLTRPTTWSSQNFKPGKVGPWFVALLNDLNKAGEKLDEIVKRLMPDPAMLGGQATLGNQALASQGYPQDQSSAQGQGAPAGQKPAKRREAMEWIDASYKVIEKTTDTAKVEFQFADGTKEQVTFKKVARSWLPQPFADKWQVDFAAARSKLDGMDAAAIDKVRQGISGGLTVINGVLGTLANAKTQQEFNQLVDPLIGRFEQGFRAGYQAAIQSGGAAGQPGYGQPSDQSGYPPPGYGPGYGQPAGSEGNSGGYPPPTGSQ